jgi:thiol-disulfide isomerase/thioredoxin
MPHLTRFLLIFFLVAYSCDHVQTAKPAYDEASLKTFVLSTPSIDNSQAALKLDSILKRAGTDSTIFRQTISFLQEPFSHPNSGYRNAALYSKLLQSQIQSRWYGTYEKQVADEKLQLLRQNDVGNAANNFEFLTPHGQKKKMYDLKSKLLLLFFFNPECEACKEMKQALQASGIINEKIASGDLKLLAVYTDKDTNTWRKHLPEVPRQWINGRDEDENLYKNRIYDLSAIPTIYLLNQGKKVLLKDCTSVPQLESKINNKSETN